MPRIKDVRTTIYEWVGPVAPMPPHFCTTASDLVADVTGSIAGFRFLGCPLGGRDSLRIRARKNIRPLLDRRGSGIQRLCR